MSSLKHSTTGIGAGVATMVSEAVMVIVAVVAGTTAAAAAVLSAAAAVMAVVAAVLSAVAAAMEAAAAVAMAVVAEAVEAAVAEAVAAAVAADGTDPVYHFGGRTLPTASVRLPPACPAWLSGQLPGGRWLKRISWKFKGFLSWCAGRTLH
jgi:hypothetical protein